MNNKFFIQITDFNTSSKTPVLHINGQKQLHQSQLEINGFVVVVKCGHRID
jgi:hypothetical protein